MSSHGPSAVAFVAMVLALSAACGSDGDGRTRGAPAPIAASGDRELPRRIEARVAASLSERYGAAVERVTCPAEVEVGVGATLGCTAALANGSALPVEVELTTIDGDYIAREKPVVLLGKLASVIAERYRARGEPVGNVDCGGTIRVSEPGTTFECTVSGGGAPRRVGAEITSWQGRVELAYPDDQLNDEPSPGASMEANAVGSTTP